MSSDRHGEDVAEIASVTLRAIEQLRAKMRALEVRHAALSGEHALLQGTAAGLRAQKAALQAEVSRLSPRNRLLAPDGTYEGGAPRFALDGVYEAAFDAELRARKLPGSPADYRARKAG